MTYILNHVNILIQELLSMSARILKAKRISPTIENNSEIIVKHKHNKLS